MTFKINLKDFEHLHKNDMKKRDEEIAESKQ